MTLKNDELENQSGFLQRWSNRKIESKTYVDEELKDNNISSVASPEGAVSELDEVTSEGQEFKSDEDMPPLEGLTEESNFSDFLSPNVSEALRKQALRKLFHLPFLNVVDGLDDYAEDYTKFAALGDIIPHEMKRMLDREKKKELEKEQLEQKKLTEDAESTTPESSTKESIHAGVNENAENDITVDDDAENEKNNELNLSKLNVDEPEMPSADGTINLKEKHDNEKLN
jgi:hypothetical protein